MIQIQDVSFEYEKEQGTLSHIDLKIQQGECVVLTGESGCGKTTVTKLINGLIPHFVEGGTLSGTTIVNGMEVPKTEMYRLAEQVGSVFQNPKSQFFNIDSDSEITFGLENAGVEPKKIKERYKATVSALKIQSLLGRNIFSMSGGEKQSLAFASVYAMNPSIFVLDEPTANLDADAIDTLRQQIIQIKKEGRTVVIAEHRLYFLMDLIDRAIFIQKGKIVQIFSRDEFRNLSDEQRIRMGLRSLVHPVLEVPHADPPGAQEGLSVENLSCAFDKQPVFSGLGFSAKRGEVLGIVGHNGAGKTTMTRCLCGLLKEVNGTVRLDGQTLKAKQRNKASFCVMQDVNHQLFSDSVWNECELAQPDCPPERIEEILRSFDLLDFKDRHPMALSGGQKQRVAIARALASDPKILLCDEATSALDPQTTSSILELLKKINKQFGITIVIITHQMSVVREICTHVAIMYEGEVVEKGLVADIFANPQSEVAKELIRKDTGSDIDADSRLDAGREKGQAEIKSGEKIRIVFSENSAFEPVIANLILTFGEPVNILKADTKNVGGVAKGEMILEFMEGSTRTEMMKQYLKEKGLAIGEVTGYVGS